MLEQLVKSPIIDYTQRGMAAANLRHEVISDNLANVNTPNFKKTDVVFEELLAQELYGDEDAARRMKLVRTHDRHMPFATSPKRAQPMFEKHNERSMRVDDNNVDIDIEMANMAKNQLYYNALATRLNGHVSLLKTIMTSGQ